jgi:hypothetical protein
VRVRGSHVGVQESRLALLSCTPTCEIPVQEQMHTMYLRAVMHQAFFFWLRKHLINYYFCVRVRESLSHTMYLCGCTHAHVHVHRHIDVYACA